VRAHPLVKKYWVDTGDASRRPGMACDESYTWELYDLSTDRSEVHDVAGEHPEIVSELSGQWHAWAERVGVIPLQEIVDAFAERGLPYREAIG